MNNLHKALANTRSFFNNLLQSIINYFTTLEFNNSRKALAITILISATFVLSVISVELQQYSEEVAEIFIEITPETILEETDEEQELIDSSPKTNKSFNTTEKYKHFAQAYKPIAPPKDFEDPRLTKNQEEPYEIKKASKTTTDAALQNEELTAFESANSILNKRSQAVKNSSFEATANKNSSLVYALKDRTDEYLPPIPIYLCETNGKIVVEITVNANGAVVNTAILNASSSSNKCLQQHALDFAESAKFNTADLDSQTGTITFSFEGK